MLQEQNYHHVDLGFNKKGGWVVGVVMPDFLAHLDIEKLPYVRLPPTTKYNFCESLKKSFSQPHVLLSWLWRKAVTKTNIAKTHE